MGELRQRPGHRNSYPGRNFYPGTEFLPGYLYQYPRIAIPLTAAAIRWGTRVLGTAGRNFHRPWGPPAARLQDPRVPGYPCTPVPTSSTNVTSMHTREPGYNCTRVLPPGARIQGSTEFRQSGIDSTRYPGYPGIVLEMDTGLLPVKISQPVRNGAVPCTR
eukprot:3935334-Rhodomonas_salina.1